MTTHPHLPTGPGLPLLTLFSVAFATTLLTVRLILQSVRLAAAD